MFFECRLSDRYQLIGGLLVLSLLLLLAGCSSDEQSPTGSEPEGQQNQPLDLTVTGDLGSCKSFASAALGDVTPNDQDCVEYEYTADGVLHVTRINAGFNCCPDGFEADITVDNGNIRVVETDILSMPCTCLCLFDFAYSIDSLPPGVYEIQIVEIWGAGTYYPEDAPLTFTVDLTEPTSGSFCVERTHYPWNQEY